MGGRVVAEIFRIPSPETDPIRSREKDTYHTFAHLPRYSGIDKPIWQDKYTNKKITHEKKKFKWSRGARAPLDPPIHYAYISLMRN